jgi:hypothetical protein
MRVFVAFLCLPLLACAAILPDTIGLYHRAPTASAPVTDKPLWEEYGLKESEHATYQNGSDKFTATAWRLQDPTAALAAFDWQRPASSQRAKAAATAVLAAETDDSLLVVHGNYLLSFNGYKPVPAELAMIFDALKNVDTTPLPTLPGHLPDQDLVPNSERYVIGPTSLQRFNSGIPPSVAGFRYSAEAQLGVYRNPKGDANLAIFSYPTPQIAMQRATEFEKIPGALAKRTGPLVAVILSPPDPDFAEKVLANVRYEAAVTRDEYVPTRRDNIGELLLNAFILIGILLGFAVVSGLALGGVRAFLRRGKTGADAEAMITLHLEQR